MMDVLEETIYGQAVRVLEWKEEEDYFSSDLEVSESVVLFMIRAHVGTGVEEFTEFPDKKDCVFTFNREDLDSLPLLLHRSILSKQIFLKDSNAGALSAAIFTSLGSKFLFFTLKKSSKIVTVAEVFVERFVDNSNDQENTINSSLSDEDEEEEAEDTDINVDDVEQGTDHQDEDLMGDDHNVAELEIRGGYLDILKTLRWCLPIEPIGTEKPEQVLKEVEATIKINRLMDGDRLLAADKCPVCLQDFLAGAEVATMPCLHVFHVDCISKWLSNNNSCPMCRLICTTDVFL